MPKRAELTNLTFHFVALPFVEMNLCRRALSLFTHPFMHRRCLMACFHRSFKWLHSLTPRAPTKWPPDVKEELLAAALMLPLAHPRLRWELSTRVSATDATPTRGGAVACHVSPKLVKEIYRHTEHRGCYVSWEVGRWMKKPFFPTRWS